MLDYKTCSLCKFSNAIKYKQRFDHWWKRGLVFCYYHDKIPKMLPQHSNCPIPPTAPKTKNKAVCWRCTKQRINKKTQKRFDFDWEFGIVYCPIDTIPGARNTNPSSICVMPPDCPYKVEHVVIEENK